MLCAAGCSSPDSGTAQQGAQAGGQKNISQGQTTLPAPAQRTPDPVDPDEKNAPHPPGQPGR